MQRLGLDFSTASPGIDESARPGEAARDLVLRLARAKAGKVAGDEPGLLVIGSDQVALLNGAVVNKPGSHEQAVSQLRAASGQCLHFLTGICLLNSSSGTCQLDCVETLVYFRELSHEEIEDYLRREQPYDCAGSFKSEQLGIALVRKINGDDPSALVGLPLIRLCEMLVEAGVKIL